MKKFKIILAFVFTVLILSVGCRKKDDSGQDDYIVVSSYAYRTNIAGRVLDENKKALSGVVIMANGNTTSSDNNGVFILKNMGVNKDRCIIRFTKSGYFLRSHAIIPTLNSVNYLNVVLINNTTKQALSSATGGTISLADLSSVQFPPNAFVVDNGTTYNGMVYIVLKHLSPGSSNFGLSIPGGDLLGNDVSGNDVALYSYGMLGVTLTGSGGEALQLANGILATITSPIAATQLATAPATIPLWYFDESTALWKEQGVANKVGNRYIGTVSHFSWWNCDYPGERANIQGKVVDCILNGIPNATVTIDGWYQTITDQNGEYHDWVPAGMSYTIQVLLANNPGLSDSQLENIPTLSAGQLFTVPDLNVSGGCRATIKGVLKSCAGANADGLVFINNGNNYFNYQYTINGEFNCLVVADSELFLNAVNLNGSYQSLVPAITPFTTVDVGNMTLCTANNVPLYENGFVLNGNGFVNRVFIIDTTNTMQLTNADTISYVVFGNDHLAGLPCLLQIVLHETEIGFYNYPDISNRLNIDVDGSLGGMVQYQSIFYPSQGAVEITRYDNIGGRIMANFSGTLVDYSNGGLVYVTNGRMNVPRRP